MGSSGLVKISGCSRDADGVQAHLETSTGAESSTRSWRPSVARARGGVVNDWGLALDVQAASIRSESGFKPLLGDSTRINPQIKFGHSEDVGEFARP
jgi:hypothetical protein